MRWWVLLLLILGAFVADTAFAPALSVWGYCPSFMLVLLAFVTLYASPQAALGSALLAGLYVDVQAPAVFPTGGGYVIGPHALAMTAAAWLVLHVRESLFRRNALTVAATAFLLTATQALVFLAIAGLRLAYADPAPLWGGGRGVAAFAHSLVDGVYTALLTLPLAWVIHPMSNRPHFREPFRSR